MKKTEYLHQLERYLRKLPDQDYQEAMDYFNEYFDEAGPEEEETVMAELGTPKEAAHDIITQLLDKQFDKTQNTPKYKLSTIIGLSVLALFAAPIAAPVLLFIVAGILFISIFILAGIVVAVIFGFSLIMVGASLLVETFVHLGNSYATIALGSGLSLGAIGVGILLILITITLAKWTGILTYKITKHVIKRR